MKKEIILSIKEKEIQLAKLKPHVDKSTICSELYNKVVLEKAILTKQLEDAKKSNIIEGFKNLKKKKKTLICDYFKK